MAFLVTGSVLALAGILAWLLYTEYHSNPWTRDAHVRANVIEIAPRVAGPIVNLAVSDNAPVQRGQLLFEIDPSDYQNALAIAQSVFDQRQAEFVNAQAAFARSQRLFGTNVISKGEIDLATASFQSAKALYDGSCAALREAKLNLDYTKVYAPASGYVSGVTFGLGTYVQIGKPVFVLIDRDSYWVTALFKETVLPSLKPAGLSASDSLRGLARSFTGRSKAWAGVSPTAMQPILCHSPPSHPRWIGFGSPSAIRSGSGLRPTLSNFP